MLYYKYSILWKTFFTNLDCQVVLSPETNKKILEDGIKSSIDESCLSFKIYLGHINYLVDKCDYLLVPRVSDYGNGKKVCVKFNALFDNVKNMYQNIKILNYNIEHTKYKYEFFEFIKMGLKVNKNIIKVIYSYLKAKQKQKKFNISNINTQKNIISKQTKKILLVSHPYNTYDKYIGSSIIDYLEENNIDVLYPDKIDTKIAIEYSKELSPTLYWIYSKELIGAINYYKNVIDGIIFLSTFPCGVDSLVNELMLRKIKDIPKINIIVDEATMELGIITRLESFIDIIKGEI